MGNDTDNLEGKMLNSTFFDMHILDFYFEVVSSFVELCANLLVAETDVIKGDYVAYLEEVGFKNSVKTLEEKIKQHLFRLDPDLIFKLSVAFWFSVDDLQDYLGRLSDLNKVVKKVLKRV